MRSHLAQAILIGTLIFLFFAIDWESYTLDEKAPTTAHVMKQDGAVASLN